MVSGFTNLPQHVDGLSIKALKWGRWIFVYPVLIHVRLGSRLAKEVGV